MSTEEDPRPLDAIDGEAPESLARALRALGRERPSDAFLQAAAARLEASIGVAPRGAVETAKRWPGSSTKLLGGKLIAAALVLGGAALSLRSALPVVPTAAPAMTSARLLPPANTAQDEAPSVDALAQADARRAELGAPPRQQEQAAEAAPLQAPDRTPARAEAATSPNARRTAPPPVARVGRPSVARAAQRHAGHVLSPLSAAPTAVPAAAAPDQQVAMNLASPPAELGGEAAMDAPRPPAAAGQARQLGAESPASLAPQAARPVPPTEVELLLDAKRHAGSDPAGTLRAVAEHARRFPDGALAPEREVLAIEALRALGKTAEAEQRLHKFQARYPGSIHVRGLSSQAP